MRRERPAWAPPAEAAPGASTKRAGTDEIHPVRWALDKLLALDAPYKPREIVVVLAIVRHMKEVENAGRPCFRCFPGYERLRHQTRISERDVQRILRDHCERSPLPLLKRFFTKDRKSYTYELVLDSEAFARARVARPRRANRGPLQAATTTPVQTVAGDVPSAVAPAGAVALPILRRPVVAHPAPRPSKVAARAKPNLYECRCGAQVARWDDGTVVNVDNGFVTTGSHACPTADADRTNRPTNTFTMEEPDRTNGPTNTWCASAACAPDEPSYPDRTNGPVHPDRSSGEPRTVCPVTPDEPSD